MEDARFCHSCGSPVIAQDTPAEFKQVTVLFADVVRSMDIASKVGAERLREIMGELVNGATAVVERYGGTVDMFTGDGLMATFGAPRAEEDHAIRACLAALDVQRENAILATAVLESDAELSPPESVHIKGVDEAVTARRLLAIGRRRSVGNGTQSSLVGRRWEMAAVEGILDRTRDGRGGVVSVVGPPGIGKSPGGS
jgi:hypothetical protein